MLTLVLLLVFGAGVSYFALQNTVPVTLKLGQYTFYGVPLFDVIIGSMLSGVLIAGAIYVVHLLSSSLTIYGKNKKIKAAETEAGELLKRVHQLELENERLKKNSGEVVDDKAL